MESIFDPHQEVVVFADKQLDKKEAKAKGCKSIPVYHRMDRGSFNILQSRGSKFQIAPPEVQALMADPKNNELRQACIDKGHPIELLPFSSAPKAEPGEKATLPEAIASTNKKFGPALEKLARAEKPKKEKKTFEGHFLTGVLRTLGTKGWSFEEADRAMKKLGFEVPMGTIKCQITDGVKGRFSYGKPAELTAAQIKTLEEARGPKQKAEKKGKAGKKPKKS